MVNHLFHSGWRPVLGWLCVAALAATWFELTKTPSGEIIPVLFGLGGLRTFEKLKGVAK